VIAHEGNDTTGMYGSIDRNAYGWLGQNHPELADRFA
jgi:hypothetical protein